MCGLAAAVFRPALLLRRYGFLLTRAGQALATGGEMAVEMAKA